MQDTGTSSKSVERFQESEERLGRKNLQIALDSVFPVRKVVRSPERYPYYQGGLDGFDITALPNVYNPITRGAGEKGFDVLLEDFIDGEKVRSHQPESDGYIYREFHMDRKGILAFAELEPGGSPTWNEIEPHWTLGYLGIRKAALQGRQLSTVLLEKYGIPDTYLKPGNQRHHAFYHFYRQLDVEEQGLSTNLVRKSAHFMEGCYMHRLSIAAFLRRFPFGVDSPLILDWDYGYTSEVAPARDSGHVDIKLNPLWLSKAKPWKGKILSIDGNFYRDMLNQLLSENKDLWEPVQ